MQVNKVNITIVAIIFFCSLALRLGLSLYNRDANDPHGPVIVYIVKNNQLPEKLDCWECFQPKLFHYTIAQVINVLGLIRRNDVVAQKIVGQLMNFSAGAITLLVSWMFISQFPTAPAWSKVVAFALLAFNPQLIGINSQVTNDAFLIMFCTLAIYCTYLFLKGSNIRNLLFAIFFSALAVSTKTNGWVTVIAISMTLFIRFFIQRPWSAKLCAQALGYLFAVPILATLNPLTQYRHNYQLYGSPVVIALERQPAPPLFEETYLPYAGILSVQDGFFTFKFMELIRNPLTDVHEKIEGSTARTSLWTQLYGNANSIHFENYPPTWRTSSAKVLAITRGIFALALLPVILLLAGAATETFTTAKALLDRNVPILENESFGLFVLLFIGHLLFMVLYAFEYRLYIFFKAIFIYPGLLAFLALFLKGSAIASYSPRIKRGAITVFEVLVAALLLLYILDVTNLIFQLLPNGSGITILWESLRHIWW